MSSDFFGLNYSATTVQAVQAVKGVCTQVHNGYHLACNRLLQTRIDLCVCQIRVCVQANTTPETSEFSFGWSLFVCLANIFSGS